MIWIVEYATFTNEVHAKLFTEESDARAFYESLDYCKFRNIGQIRDIWWEEN